MQSAQTPSVPAAPKLGPRVATSSHRASELHQKHSKRHPVLKVRLYPRWGLVGVDNRRDAHAAHCDLFQFASALRLWTAGLVSSPTNEVSHGACVWLASEKHTQNRWLLQKVQGNRVPHPQKIMLKPKQGTVPPRIDIDCTLPEVCCSWRSLFITWSALLLPHPLLVMSSGAVHGLVQLFLKLLLGVVWRQVELVSASARSRIRLLAARVGKDVYMELRDPAWW